MVDFPAGLIDLDDAATDNSATPATAFGGTVNLGTGLNRIKDNLADTQAKIGTGSGAPIANSVMVGNGTGTSTWLAGLTSPYLAAGAVTQRVAVAQFTGNTGGTSMVDVNASTGKVTLTTAGGDLLVLFFGSCSNTNGGIVQNVALRLDSGSDVNGIPVYSYAGLATYPVPFFTAALFTALAAGSHTVSARHQNVPGAGSTMTTIGYMIGLEIKK